MRELAQILLLSGVVLLLFPGGSTAQSNGSPSFSFVTIDTGVRSGIRDHKLLVIRRQSDWHDLWIAHRPGKSGMETPPAVNFETYMILAVFAGEKPTGGVKVEIFAVEEDRTNSRVYVRWRQIKPPPGAMNTQVLTQPYHIVMIEKNNLPVDFRLVP